MVLKVGRRRSRRVKKRLQRYKTNNVLVKLRIILFYLINKSKTAKVVFSFSFMQTVLLTNYYQFFPKVCKPVYHFTDENEFYCVYILSMYNYRIICVSLITIDNYISLSTVVGLIQLIILNKLNMNSVKNHAHLSLACVMFIITERL